MTQNPDMPLTPPELFRRGIEITQEIRGRIIETRAYYLGRSSREPAQPLSEIFDPTRGPILKYFVQTVRTITRTPFIERHCQSAAFREFRQSSEATLEELRLLAIQLAMCLGVPDKTDRRRSVGQALKTSVYFFRVVIKTASNTSLVAAIRAVAAGKRPIPPEVEQLLKDDTPAPELTARQREILESITKGLPNKQIATHFGISLDGVKRHVQKICARIGAANRSEAVAIALRKHLLKI